MNYQFAVICRGDLDPRYSRENWGTWGWSQSEKGAATMARTAGKCYRQVEIVPATAR